MFAGDHRLDARANRIDRGDQFLTTHGQRHSTSVPNQERVVQDDAELGERGAHRGLGQPNGCAGARKISLAQQRLENGQQVEID